MTDILERICAEKRELVKKRKAQTPLAVLEAAAQGAVAPRGFLKALKARLGRGQYGLIAEIKRASPSAGLIRPDFDPVKLAQAYEKGGAACLSVLTDRPHFQGDDRFIGLARGATQLPVLRKDFLVDPYQIVESRALGADAVLVILAALPMAMAVELEDLAMRLGMDVLVEVHDEAELDRALKHLKSPLMGINNRNLKTLAVDIETAARLAPRLPPGRLAVAESGLSTPADLARMAAAGARLFLIGEALMRQPDVEAATRSLLRDPVPSLQPLL